MRIGEGHDRYVKVVSFAGNVIAFAARSTSGKEGTHRIGYSVLNPAPQNPHTDAAWTDFRPLEFPRELRPVGRSVITVDFGADEIPVDGGPFAVVADDRQVYVFRRSVSATLYFDRFAYDDVAARLVTAPEVRFRRSRKPDIPLDRRDTLGQTDMTDRRFAAPTIELGFVDDVGEGRFTALILPTDLTGVDRWQIFAQQGAGDPLRSFSIPRSSDGAFDLSEVIDPDTNTVPPERAFSLQSDGKPLALTTGPDAVLYHQQEWLPDDEGRLTLQKLEGRVMLAAGAGAVGLAVVDFAVGVDGRIAQIEETVPMTPAPAVGTALDFTAGQGTQVAIPAVATGAELTIEAWIAPRAIAAGSAPVLAGGDPAVALTLEGGIPAFTGPGGKRAIGDVAVPTRGWTHLAGAWDGAPTLYVNGQPFEAEGAAAVAPAATGGGFTIAGDDGITGSVDEVRLWSAARSRDDVLGTMSTTLTPASPGWADLAGYWRLDEPGDDTRFTTVANSSSVGSAADGVLTGARWVATSAPTTPSLEPVAWADNGLTAATALVGFAQSAAAPSLAEGPDSTVHVYFSGQGNVLSAAHLSAVVQRARYGIAWVAGDEGGTAHLVARQAGAAMTATASSAPPAIVTAVKGDAQHVQVKLTSYTGYTEVWPRVPLELSAFATVLNGDAAQSSDDPAQKARDEVQYDYTRVEVTAAGGQLGPAPAPGTGSALFGVLTGEGPTGGVPAAVQTTDEVPLSWLGAGVDPVWQAAPPVIDLSLGADETYVSVLDYEAITAYSGPLRAERDVAIEAWIKPHPSAGGGTVFVFNQPGAVSYMLGLDPSGHVVAGYGEVIAVADRAVANDQWTHVAASYRTDFGIQLGGERYLDAGNDRSLDSSDAVTAEAWIRLDAIGARQTVMAKTDPSAGRSWELAVGADGKLELTVQQSTATGTAEHTVRSAASLATGAWHHVAGVYDVAFENQVALMFASGDYVAVPALSKPVTDGVTVMMWAKSTGTPSGLQTLIQSVDPKAPLTIALSLQDGKPTFIVDDSTGQHTVTAEVAVRADDWQHVAATYTAGQPPLLLLDGVVVATGTGPTEVGGVERPSADVEAEYTVGGFAQQNSYTGALNELSVWDRGLSVDEIRQRIQVPLSQSERGLAGYWRLNDLFGTTVMDLVGTANGQVKGAQFIRVDKGAFAHKVFIDGHMEAFERVLDPVVVSEAPVTLGSAHFAGYLQGAVAEMRLWNAGRMNWQIEHFMARDLEPNAKGLIAHWPFDTGSGRVAFDAKGDNNAVIRDGQIDLTDQAVAAMWIRTTFKAGWTIWLEGAEVGSKRTELDADGYGDQQAQIAALSKSPTIKKYLNGEIAELRVWDQQVTGPQVRGAMYGRLTGGEPGLAGYWPFDDGSGQTVADRSGWGANGSWMGLGEGPSWQLADVPIGDEGPAIVSVPGRRTTARTAKSTLAPGTASYGQVEPRDRGALVAVLKMACAYVAAADETLELLAGTAVGDLALQYVGQAQLAPTLVGYIEGAPPLPAENLKVYPGSPDSYAGATTLMLDETGSRTFTYTANRDVGTDTSLTTQMGFNVETETEAGIGVSQEVFSMSFGIGLEVSVDQVESATAEASVSEESQSANKNYVETRGHWYENKYAIDGGYGQIFYPDNRGYALVRSGTADVFAMRIRATGTLVGYSSRPNPDIPEDVNVIAFRLDDRYVKNGTLDGWIGYQPDESYSYLQPGERGSYFKPLEAYALKQAIDREQKLREAYFTRFDAEGLGQRTNVGRAGSPDIASEQVTLANVLMGVTDKSALTGDQWKARMARRDLVNTYVWTSDGGLHSDEEQFVAVREQSTGGSLSLTSKVGIYTDLSLNVGPTYALNAMFGSHITTHAAKADREQWQFLMDVTASGERYIGQVADDGEGGEKYLPDPSPGKVRGYRWMSFYLAPSKRNFSDFDAVVDQDWLHGTGAYAGNYDPDALALRQALTSPNETWRVLHRVTYVSRVPPKAQTEGESLGPAVRKPDELSVIANRLLLDELPTDPAGPNPMVKVSQEADSLLAELEKNPVWGARLASRSAEIKRDAMTYVGSYYGIPA